MHRLPAQIMGVLTLLMLLTISSGVVLADRQAVTNIFCAAATTGEGQQVPVDVLDQEVLPNGMVRLRYRYHAHGDASGDLPGSFTYDEFGHYLTRGGTLVGGGPEKQMIVLVPEHGPRITLVDAHPERYEFGVATIHLVELPDSAKASVDHLIQKGWLVPQDGRITYGYFTFFQRNERFIGYATPDFRRFCLQITIDRSVRLYFPVVRGTEG